MAPTRYPRRWGAPAPRNRGRWRPVIARRTLNIQGTQDRSIAARRRPQRRQGTKAVRSRAQGVQALGGAPIAGGPRPPQRQHDKACAGVAGGACRAKTGPVRPPQLPPVLLGILLPELALLRLAALPMPSRPILLRRLGSGHPAAPATGRSNARGAPAPRRSSLWT